MHEFWNLPDAAAGERFYTQWHRNVMRSKLQSVKKVARTLKAHLVNLLTYFQHPITHAITEGFNSISKLMRFHRLENYRPGLLETKGRLT